MTEKSNEMKLNKLIPKGLKPIFEVWACHCGWSFDAEVLKLLVLIDLFIMYMSI